MHQEVKYNRVAAVVILDAFDSIPKIRDGKADGKAVTSYLQDLKQFQEFRKAYSLAQPEELKGKIAQWNEYTRMRNDEDFVPYSESKNKEYYYSIF